MDKSKHMSMSFPVNFSIVENFNSNKFVKLRLDFAHDGTNPNRSRFTKELLNEKKDTLFLSPILGHIIETDNDSYDFGGHDIEFRPNPFQDGKMQAYYLETVLGIIPPEELADFEIKEVNGRNRVFVNAYLYKRYSNFAEDILKQYESNPVSMEADILKYTFSSEENVYDIQDFEYLGVTLLNQEMGTGMIDANAKFFTEEKNAKEQMIVMLHELKKEFSLEANDKNTEEGGIKMEETKTVEVAEVETVNEVETPEVAETNVGFEATVEDVTTPSENNAENNEVVVTETPVTEPVTEQPKVVTDNFVKAFSWSCDNIRYQLYSLLAETEQAQNEHYFIETVRDNYFDYCSESDKCFRQNYSKTETGVQFNGERVEMISEKFTVEERAALDQLRSNYEAQTQELETLRAFKQEYDIAEKRAVLDKWEAKIGKTAEFEALKNDFENRSVKEIETECKCIFADNNAFTAVFSATKNKKTDEFTPVVVNVHSKDEAETSNNPYNGFIEEFASR